MRPGYLLGIDSGSSVTKAVVFDTQGRTKGIGRSLPTLSYPQPDHVERSMEEAWRSTVQAIRNALIDAHVVGQNIMAVGLSGHGDGLYPLTAELMPAGNAITSLDDRAQGILAQWHQQGKMKALLQEIGQQPVPYSPVALLAWLKQYQPDRYKQIHHVLFAKDWLRFKLTAELATDLTDAGSGYTNVHTQRFSREALKLMDIDSIHKALPEMLLPQQCAGHITSEAAKATGLLQGTPVATGLHDVVASALGLNNTKSGDLTITAGTFSVNEVFSSTPHPDPRWATRNGLRPGQWVSMAISPASSSNLEWFYKQWSPQSKPGGARHFMEEMDPELNEAFASPSRLVYHPFLFGSPYPEAASAALIGLRGWHTRAHILRAIMEGVVFNNRVHVEALAMAFPIHRISITGGGSHSPRFAQLFADILAREIRVSSCSESAAWGAAKCAGVACGAFPTLEECTEIQATIQSYTPESNSRYQYQLAFERYQQLIESLRPFWGDEPGNVDSPPTESVGASSLS